MNEPEIRRHIDDILTQHMQDEDARFDGLLSEIKELKQDIKDLTAAWQQAKGVISFVKWIAAISGSLGAFILFIKDHVK